MNDKKKMNVIDIIIIIAVIVIISVCAVRAILQKNYIDKAKIHDFSYTVRVDTCEKRYFDSLSIGDKLYFGEKAIYCGTISEVIPEYAIENVVYEDFSTNSHKNPYYIDIVLKVNVSGRKLQDKIYIGENTNIGVGKFDIMHSDDFGFSGRISEIYLN